MAYQYPGMGGVPTIPGANYMPQMGNPYMNQAPQFSGMPNGYGPRPGYPAMQPGQFGQGMPQMPMQGPGMGSGRSRRPGLISRLGSGQQGAPNINQGNNFGLPQQFQQPQQSSRGFGLGRGRQQPFSQLGGAQRFPQQSYGQQPMFQQGMPQQPMMQQPMMQQPIMQQSMQQPMQGPNVSPMGKQIKPKQFVLSAPGGTGGSGVATIPNGNTLSLVANNLPDPVEMGQGQNVAYVAYLTNRKGQGAFPLGPLSPIGGGTYRLNFNSNVPFYDYDQVLVSLENPYALQNNPSGQVVLASTGGAGISMPKPVRKFFGGLWSKVKGAGKGISNKIGGGKKQADPAPEIPQVFPNFQTTNLQTPNLQTPNLQNLFNNYTLGPGVFPQMNGPNELPGLGAPTEAPFMGENP